MEIKLTLRRQEEMIEGHEAQIVDTEGERLILIRLPIPEAITDHAERREYISKQAMLIREFCKDDPMILIVPTSPGDICEIGVAAPSVEDMKECFKRLPLMERREFLIEACAEQDHRNIECTVERGVMPKGVEQPKDVEQKFVKCANCGRTQEIREMADVQGREMTPFERQRQRWLYYDKLDIVLCGGSLRADGIDDGKDWCQHLHYENNQAAYPRDGDPQVMEIFLPGITGTVPKGVEKHVQKIEDGPDI